MKIGLLLLFALSLASCAALGMRDACHFTEVPKKYRWDQGKLVIDHNTRQPVVNLKYQQYLKCYPEYEKQPQVTVLANIQHYLKDSYQVLGQTYQLTGQREFKPGAVYIASYFQAIDNSGQIKQELFFYNDAQSYARRFLIDLNKNSGHFTQKKLDGIEYIQGKNHQGEEIIYLVRTLEPSIISVVLFMPKQALTSEQFLALINALYLI